MADPWEEYAPAATPESPPPAAAQTVEAGPWDDFRPQAAEQQQPSPPNLSDPDTRQIVRGKLGHVWDAFTGGMQEAWGTQPLGMSDKDVSWMQEHGIFRKERDEGVAGVFKAFNEGVFYQGAKVLDATVRRFQGLYVGTQQAAIAAGVPRDIAGMPDAFMGMPHPTGVPHGVVAASVEALPLHVRSVLADAKVADAIDNGPVNRANHVPYEAGASSGADVTTNIDKSIPETATLPSGKSFDTATPMKIHEQVEKDVMERLIKGGMDEQTAYRVAHWEFAEKAEDAWYQGQGIEPAEAEKWWQERSGQIQHEPTADTPPNLYDKPYPHDQVSLSRSEPAEATARPSPEEISRAQGILGERIVAPAVKVGEEIFTGSFHGDAALKAADKLGIGIDEVIDRVAREMGSDDMAAGFVTTTGRYVGRAEAEQIARDAGQLKGDTESARMHSTDLDLGQARELGVTGPPKPDIRDMKPAEAAKTISAAQAPDEKLVGPEPAGNAWRDRFEKFVGKLKAPGDVQQLIRDAAGAQNEFPAARRGDIPLAHVEAVAQAAGVEPSSINARGLGRMLKNDAEVRVAMQLMLQVTEDVKSAARDVKADGGEQSLIAMQEAIMRRDLAVEQVVGMRAEWGRTGNVFQEFLRDVKDQEGLSQFLKDRGRSPDDLRKIADMVDGLEPGQAARFLNDARKPNFWDKFIFYWVNALISGPVTHAKYIGANAAFAGYEAAVVTPIAGAIGAVREALGAGTAERVYLGEGAARLWGLVAGTPDAIRAAVEAARKGIQVPLPGEVAKNINPVINMRPKPIDGAPGAIIGAPSRGAAGIHSFFNFLGYRAELEAQAYRQAAKEGLSPLSDDFWRRRGEVVANPTDAMMDKAIENGYHLTFITEQGAIGKAVSQLANVRFGNARIQPFKLIFPFTHIPGNIMKAGLEQTPAAFLDTNMRADLMGRNGAVARDTAHARLIAGGAVSAMVVNWAINDNITGFGPTDQTERAIWLRTHEPYSVKIGSNWVSYNRFGPLGDLIGIIANLVDIAPKLKDAEYAEGAGQILKASSHLVMDEVGMQGLTNLIGAMEEPDRQGARFVSSMTATALPYSSLLRQTASITDPYVREAKTFVDGLRNAVPWARQELLPRRDWLGAPLANPGYGTLLRTREVNTDPVDLEVQRLHVKPSPPQDRIGGVKLTPEMYDRYQAAAGPVTRAALESLVQMPGWADLPDFVRETAFHRTIEASRRSAAAYIQAANPILIQQGVQQRIDHITGASHTARPKRPPELAP